MRLALFLALICSTAAEAQGAPWHRKFKQRNLSQDSREVAPLFSFASPTSYRGTSGAYAGLPATDGCHAPASVTGTKGEALTFARGSAGEVYSSDGQTLTKCTNDQVRISSGTAGSTERGLWVEGARANLVLRNRDLSNAAWTPSNMTCARTATGMRADANGASTCTATAGNATILQAVTVASALRSTSMHIKRRTGTGVVEVTRDNGTTWSAVTASLSSTVWRRVVSSETAGCAGGNCIVVSAMAAEAANPTIGIRLVTSGDAVDVDFVQDEDGPFPSAPIETEGIAVGRSADQVAFASTLTSMAATGCTSADFVGESNTGSGIYNFLVSTSAAAASWPLYLSTANNTLRAYDGTNEPSVAYASTPGTVRTIKSYWTGSSLVVVNQSVGTRTVGSFDGAMAVTGLFLGNSNGTGGLPLWGVIKNVMLDATYTRCLEPQLDWIGDSITAGTGSTPDTPPAQLGAAREQVVVNAGTGGDTTSQCATRWTNTYRASISSTLIWSCGVNDVANGTSGATAAANAIAVFADAVAVGKRVVITGILPWKNSAGWSAPKDTEGDAYNAAVSAWAAANGQVYISPATLGGEGGDPDVLLAAYDSGDSIHPNADGVAELVALIQAAYP